MAGQDGDPITVRNFHLTLANSFWFAVGTLMQQGMLCCQALYVSLCLLLCIPLLTVDIQAKVSAYFAVLLNKMNPFTWRFTDLYTEFTVSAI